MTVLPAQNMLAEETSPYLQQHSLNPVHWRPWSAAALEEARRLDRPILLSIGYAACHWCHVMAHECFEDDTVAGQMNRLFVNIKVDREERPDLDQIYMTALTAMGEQGGWPMTMFLTPSGDPFWGGTYFPKEPRYGRPGFPQVLDAVHRTWAEKKDELVRSGENLAAHVRNRLSADHKPGEISRQTVVAFADAVLDMIDPQEGGLRGAPKFPNAPFMQLLWLAWLETRDPRYRDAVLLTLKKMLAGGIYDYVGGGLSRYSTDARWLVPHFEKMLYDNAQLIRLCSWAYAETGDELFRIRIEETAAWLLRDMRVEGGAFASSFDADSEGSEGKFYLWNQADLQAVLRNETSAFLKTFQLASPPGWEGGPILHRSGHPDYLGTRREHDLRLALDRLQEARESRIPPGRDDKALVDWNGLVIAALAEAGRTLGRSSWVDSAAEAYRFIMRSTEDGRLPHSIRGGRRLFPAIAADYAAMINAAIALYQATWDTRYRTEARRLFDVLDRWYGDGTGTGFYLTASDNIDVPMRIRGDVDDAVPSATSQTIEAMVRLSSLEGDISLYERAFATAEAAIGRIGGRQDGEGAYGQAGVMFAAGLALQPMKLVMTDDEALISEANQTPDPRRIDILAGPDVAPEQLMPPEAADVDKPGAWLCLGQVCLPPIREPEKLRNALAGPERP